MGTREVNDDHAADLSNVQDVHEVVDRLRQLFAAAFVAEQAGEATLSPEWAQSAPGR